MPGAFAAYAHVRPLFAAPRTPAYAAFAVVGGISDAAMTFTAIGLIADHRTLSVKVLFL